MARFFKKGLLILALFAVVWLAVIIWWQESRTLPTGVDIGLYLIALPLALLAMLWLGIKAVRAARAPRPVEAAATDAPAAPEAAPPAIGRLQVLASAASAIDAREVGGLLDTVNEQKRPDLDPVLKSRQDYPVFSARSARLDDGDLYLRARDRGLNADAFSASQLRAIALLNEVGEQLARAAQEAISVLDVPQREEDWPLMQVELLLPAHWQALAQAYARAALHDAMPMWPAARLSVQLHPATDAMSADALLRTLAAQPPAWRIVIAADGYIDAALIAQWEMNHLLLTPDHAQGLLPGEAAAGLLLSPDTRGQTVLLSPLAQRARSADERGAQAEEAMTALLRQLLDAAQTPAAQVSRVLADGDHRGSRPLEAAGLAIELFDHLDPAEDCVSLGTLCGHTGAASTLLTLALACEDARQKAAPVATLSLQDPALRCAALALAPAPATA